MTPAQSDKSVIAAVCSPWSACCIARDCRQAERCAADSVYSTFSSQNQRSKCRNVLDSGQIKDAQRLWQDLLILAKKHRTPGGSLDRATLVGALRSEHRLKDYPWHDADWARVGRWTCDKIEAIPCKIGNAVALERRDALDQLENDFQENRCVVLVGTSGAGKTVLARYWATAQARRRVLWFDAGTLARTDWCAVESQLRLDHSLANLLAAISDSEA